MQLIVGCGLNDILDAWDQSTTIGSAVLRQRDWPRLARLAAAVADGLEYAHTHNVLHRDVKPANLLLDTRGTVWVADFGLAKLTDQDTLTSTGAVLGTMKYMPPEAFRGQTDARTDVYGLGISLYELAVGRLPFDDSNPAALFKAVTDEHRSPPHHFDPTVPRDLETIILKATAREPHRRYQTAADLRDDLTAFANDLPIRARRSSPVERAGRWVKRNPVVAGLSAVTFTALAFAAVIGWSSYNNARDALNSETRQRAKTEVANVKLRENLELCLTAFEQVFNALSEPEPHDRPGMPPGGPWMPGGPPGGPRRPPIDAVRMLEAVLTFYEKFAEQNATNPRLQLDAARAYRKVGELHLRKGEPDRAEVAAGRAFTLLDELLRQYPETSDVSREYVITAVVLRIGSEQRQRLDRAAELVERTTVPPHIRNQLDRQLAESSN